MITAVKKGINGILHDFSGMKEPEAFSQNGYHLQAMSTNGRNHVTSYIAKHKGRRIYGRYNYQTAKYVEEIAR